MAKVRYEPNHEGLAAYLVSPEVRGMLMGHAHEAASRAEARAPVDTGEYRESIHAVNAERGGPKHDRAAAWVKAYSEHSAAVEFGNARVKAQHVLRNAVRDTVGNA